MRTWLVTRPVLNIQASSIIPNKPDQPLDAGIAIIKVKYNKKFPPLPANPKVSRHDAVSIPQGMTVIVRGCGHRNSWKIVLQGNPIAFHEFLIPAADRNLKIQATGQITSIILLTYTRNSPAANSICLSVVANHCIGEIHDTMTRPAPIQ
jgi:hypothetical protein